LWIALALFALSLSLQQIRSLDYWWHLRTGQLIVETGAVPRVDPYTYTVPGAPWIDVHWLFQLGLYAIHAMGGHTAVVLAKAAWVLLVTGLLASIGYRRERAAISVFALALALAVSGERFMPRPELPTFVCLAAVLALLERFRRWPDARVYAIVAVQALWVNVHGLYVLGLALCVFYLVAQIAPPLVVPKERFDIARIRRLGAVTALSIFASLANPNGLDGALYPIQQLAMIGPAEERGALGSLVAELIPTLSEEGAARGTLVLFAALATASFAAMALNWRRIPISDPLVLVAFLYLALGANRNVALFAIVAAPIAVRNLNEFLDARPRPLRVPAIAGATVALLLVVAAADAMRGRFFTRMGILREPGLSVMEVMHPVAAVDWIARERPAGPIYHHMADGGYLIWRLHPDYRVMVDGRLEVFGQERFLALRVVSVEQFRALDVEYRFKTALLHYSLVESTELARWLHLNSNWRMAFADDVAMVFVRVPPGETLGRAEVDIDAPDLFPPLEPRANESNKLRMLGRTNFYQTFHRYDRALELWRKAIERYPELEQSPLLLAFLLQKNGMGAAANEIMRAALAKNPDDPALYTLAADLMLETGDRAQAKSMLEAALTLDPNFPYALFRRAQIAEAEGDYEGAIDLYGRLHARFGGSSALGFSAALRLRALTGQEPSF
jgi:hypothetical protein